MRALLTAAIGAGALLMACAILKTALPPPEIDIVSPKLRAFAAHKDEFDTIFLGSSHVQHQLSPAIFDRVMGEAGLTTHSFNFGVDAMHIPESGYVLEWLLKSKPANLKWVFLELDEIQVKRLQEQIGTRRVLYWHDWKRTSLVLQRILGSGTYGRWIISPKKIRDLIIPRKDETQALFFYHLSLFTKNFTNLGRGIDATGLFPDSQNGEEARKERGPVLDGYDPNPNPMSAQKAQAYAVELTKAITNAGPKIVSFQTEDACWQSADVIRKQGAIPIFLVTPTTSQSELRFRHPPGAVLSFNDARNYPSFYRPEVRSNMDHLNIHGAEEFSRLVAQKFARQVEENQIK